MSLKNITIMLNLFILCLFSNNSLAMASCPWEKQTAADLFSFSSDLSKNKNLTQFEIEEDLECLRLLFANYYVAQNYYTQFPLGARIDELKKKTISRDSLSLMDEMFGLHKGMIDMHLSYRLFQEQKQLNFSSPTKKQVSLTEDLPHDKVVERENYTYFRPGKLMTVLNEGQQEFIDYISNNDVNLVIDMRGNGGGNGLLINQAVEILHTPDQKIPKSSSKEILSPFKEFGFCVSLIMVGYAEADEYCRRVKDGTPTETPFEELIQYRWYEKTDEFFGKREKPYKSEIIVIIDGGCASACEDMAEKLSFHPKATFVGQNTMGAQYFGNSIHVMLPNSGIVIAMPTQLVIFEADAPEGVGYTPHIFKDHIDLDKLFEK